jgi:hypothetical protein
MEMPTNFFFTSWQTKGERKNFIHSLHSEERIAVTQPDKQRAILNHFNNHLGSYVPENVS